ncbi:MAG: type II secretion system F family protein [Thaumarchaeota archaeon]|nr:type II secretion system F family protein [Nitrososphaerota archaeon]
MPLTRRQRLAYRISHKYHVRRSVFTLAIPAILGLAIFSYAIYSGFSPVPLIGSSSTVTSSAAAQAAAKEAAYAQIVAEENPGENASTAAIVIPVIHVANPHNFDLILTVSLLVALGPYSADATLAGRKVRKYEEDFTDFLFELSELIRGGIDPVKATLTLSQGSLGSITKPVQIVAKQMEIGFTFEQAMRNLAVSLKSPLVNRYIDLVIQASYSGGAVANLIQRASADMSTFLNIEEEKRAGLSQYMIVLYAGQVILIALCAILVVQFLPELSVISQLGSTSFTSSILGQADIGSVPLERDLYLLVVINGFMGGLVIGKISEGKLKHGIKHSLILVLIAFLAWTLFVVPATSATAANYNVTIASYGHTAPVSLPMVTPLVANVTTKAGAPAETVLVTFTIIGPGGTHGASTVPSSANTDSNGQASTQVFLGSVAGPYTVTATAGTESTSVIINATGFSGAGG